MSFLEFSGISLERACGFSRIAFAGEDEVDMLDSGESRAKKTFRGL